MSKPFEIFAFFAATFANGVWEWRKPFSEFSVLLRTTMKFNCDLMGSGDIATWRSRGSIP